MTNRANNSTIVLIIESLEGTKVLQMANEHYTYDAMTKSLVRSLVEEEPDTKMDEEELWERLINDAQRRKKQIHSFSKIGRGFTI